MYQPTTGSSQKSAKLSPETSLNGVLVYSHLGISRSPIVVIAYLMREYQISLKDVLRRVLKRQPSVNPKHTFIRQLRVWEKVQYQIWKDDAKTLPTEGYKDFLEERAMELKLKGRTGDEPLYPLNIP
jgi:predicted transcriptional regulator